MKRRDFCRTTTWGGAAAILTSSGIRSLAGIPRWSRDIQGSTLSGEITLIPAKAINDFAAGLRGRLITPTDADYDEARRLWNKMFDGRPALIVRCSGASDIARSLIFARERDRQFRFVLGASWRGRQLWRCYLL